MEAQTPSAPAPQPIQQVPSMPAYGQQSAPPPSAPAPTQAPAPEVAPATPTVQSPFVAYEPYGIPDEDRMKDHDGSTYIPEDSWVYPEMMRLYGLGYLDTMNLELRTYTRKSALHMLEESEDAIRGSGSDEAKEIFAVLTRELRTESTDGGTRDRGLVYGVETEYARAMGITGTSLRDSYHLGQTIVNDYGRPYEPGFNLIAGASTVEEFGRFSLYVRGEYQHAPSAPGYSLATATGLALIDTIPLPGPGSAQPTLPLGPIAAQNPFRLVEATLSFHLAGHEISGGKTDAWIGPGMGGGLAWSNNAENIYSFRINRVEPLYIPFVSRFLGPVRYDFFYGSLKGHTDPNNDWAHSEMFSFKPTPNFEFGFQRTVIFGGKGHEPVTLHTFLKGFFDISDTTGAEKISRDDPGARYTVFDLAYRVPLARKYLTFYLDSIAHDDVTPPSAPRRAAYRTGLYLSQVPGMRKLDLRAEGISTDPGVGRSYQGEFNYFEVVQRQGYTNKGFIMGDWIGRQAKGGQAWLTYHLSGNEWVQLEFLRKATPQSFILGPYNLATASYTYGTGVENSGGGVSQTSFKAQVVKRFMHNDLELNAWYQFERWKAPIYMPGQQGSTTTAVQLTYHPGLKTRTMH